MTEETEMYQPANFVLAEFIKESNLIDPQPSFAGVLIPGAQVGDLLFDNQMAAWEFIQEAIKEGLTANIALEIHRKLTKGVDFFELRGMSGNYRKCDVWIGGHKAPAAWALVDLMRGWWQEWEEATARVQAGEADAKEEAWNMHHLFESIHPFIDGNGRTGRLLLNTFLLNVNAEPVTVYYADRFDYYASINSWQKKHFYDFKTKLHGDKI